MLVASGWWGTWESNFISRNQFPNILTFPALWNHIFTCSRYVDSRNLTEATHSRIFIALVTFPLVHMGTSDVCPGRILLLTEWLSVQFSRSVVSNLCDPMNRSMPGLPVHHQFPEFTQTHVHKSVMPSSHLIFCRPFLLLPPIPPSIRGFSNESTLRMRCQSIGVSASTSVLPMNTQDWSPLGWIGWISLQSKGLSRIFSNITVQKHQFFSTQLSSQSNSHIHTWPKEKPWPWLDGLLLAK